MLAVGLLLYLKVSVGKIKDYNTFSSDYGISLKYPNSWTRIEDLPQYGANQDTYFISPKAQKLAQSQKEPLPILQLKIYQSLEELKNSNHGSMGNDEISDLAGYVKNRTGSSNSGIEIVDWGTEETSGIKMYSLGEIPTDKNWIKQLDYYAEANGKIYKLTFKDRGNYFGLSMEEKNILSTIEFTKPLKDQIAAKAIDEMNWIEYRDEKSGLQFDLPDDWQIKQDENGHSAFFSPYSLIAGRLCKAGIYSCEGYSSDFVTIRYDSFNQFKSEHKYSSSASSLKSYINDQQIRDENLIISSSERKIGPYDGYLVELGGMCGDTDLIFENKGMIYEIYSYCNESYTDVEEHIFSSIKAE